ncbi:peptide ABC transporter substrate-binding protein [Mesorhizobium sp. LSJC255A00]|uniref:ABC transporter ATP-binding protein n=1 Tax=unclassified Mesorhizobium TaxID=325217 RepID=UPI0003CE12A4|nr:MULTISPECIES: oligopeptide/dipeptide ABC transporter ATP-binding protein [unclassified Mesorhizobium]ESX20161.1 peptide ABC transporter substrate-binding protein [Mesorhizobium sp. LSJC255A00]ESX78113.1 peptide ABC transporter substrate-binding protein [Mesorhizobium sp. LSHC414A00]
MTVPILQVLGLKKYYPLSSTPFWGTKSFVHAVDDVSFDLHRGETLSLVGESGCGKSTVGRSILGLSSLTAGQIFLDGTRIDAFSQSAWRPLRRRMQFVFQDPFSSLNPRMRVRDILAEPLRNFSLATNSSDIDAKVGKLLETVSLPKDAGSRWPHEFSGGQRQRIGIARALATNPDVIVCDEAVSALDVSVKAQIINLLQDLQAELGVALLFISHDLAVVEHLTHRVAVMYLGKIVELGSKRDVFAAPRHPYTEALMSAVPVPKVGDQRRRIVLNGDIPSPINPPSGCYFHTRCPHAFDRCVRVEPELKEVTPGRFAACHLNDKSLVAGAPL